MGKLEKVEKEEDLHWEENENWGWKNDLIYIFKNTTLPAEIKTREGEKQE